MIFISYRREDTATVVTHLQERLVDRYGEDQVFVDFKEIPAGSNWPLFIQQKLAESRVLLAVIGPEWGDARFSSGKKAKRLRLDDPEDWVRLEICTAIRRGHEEMLVVVVPIDDTQLPETEWNCELDQLRSIQQARIRPMQDFESTFTYLCSSLEKQVPDLKRIASLRQAHERSSGSAESVVSVQQLLQAYLVAEIHHHAAIQLPIITQNGRPVIALINKLRVDLPLTIIHEHAPVDLKAELRWVGHGVLHIHETFRNAHTNALLVDRASRSNDTPRDCDLNAKLGPGRRLAISGDPGSGKSTLLQWISHHYAASFLNLLEPDKWSAPETKSLPGYKWVPILILCRDLAGETLPVRLEDLLNIHLKRRQFSDAAIATLIPHLEQHLVQGQGVLLVDGLDEIPTRERRIAFARLLHSIAVRFPNLPIVVSSRVVGFEAVQAELAAKYDFLLVGPLDPPAKQLFIERWSKLIGLEAADSADLIKKVLHARAVAKLTENILLLAMVTQMQTLAQQLPARRTDVYRLALKLMIQRRSSMEPPLSANELFPHLERLAYRMREQGVQRCSQAEVVSTFHDLRKSEPDESVLQTRTPEALLWACINAAGVLNVAGTEVDARGFERELIQFFHQSFQEYFAGQAILHGRDGTGHATVADRLSAIIATMRVEERQVNMWGKYNITEPVFAEYWQETLRMAIADLKPGEADEALLMLLPGPETPLPAARPRTIFALHCLVDEPRVAEKTVMMVFDSAIERLEENDGFDTKVHTAMDEAVAAVFDSAFGRAFYDQLVNRFIHTNGDLRSRAGCCLCIRHAAAPAIIPEEADAVVEAASRELSSPHQAVRVGAALALMNRLYITGGALNFLLPAQQATLINSLLAALAMDEATECAAMWALMWLTGAKYRDEPQPDLIYLDPTVVRDVEKRIQRPDVDSNTLTYGCLVLTREKGFDLVYNQRDWIYELAVVADGGKPRRSLTAPKPTGRVAPRDWLIRILESDIPLKYSCRIALSLGATGVFVSQMVQPLGFLFCNARYNDDERNEALLYLGFIGTLEAESLLVKIADTPPIGDDDYLYSRSLFGLLLLDNVDLLAGQLQKALPHSDLDAYAYGLAGSRDPRGLLLLKQLKNHPDPRIHNAAVKALGKGW